MKNHSVLFFGSEDVTALTVIRAFKKAFPSSHITTVSQRNAPSKIASKSRFVDKKAEHVSGFDEQEQLVSELSDIIARINPEVVLPVGVKHVKFLTRYKNTLSQFTQLPPLPDQKILNKLTLKDRLNKLLVELGLPSVTSKKIETGSFSELNWHSFPCLLKPIFDAAGYKIKLIFTKEELKQVLQKQDLAGNYIIQEYVEGHDIDCSLLAVDGKIVAHTIQKGIRENKLSYPTAIKMTHSPKVLEYVEKLIAATNYNGIAHLDFRYDTKDRKMKLIDFNSRFWSSILASESVGVNFVKLLYLSAKKTSFAKPNYTEGYYYMGKDVVMEIFKRLKQGRLTPAANTTYDLLTRIKDPIPELMIMAAKFRRNT